MEDFAEDMGVWKCCECGDKIYTSKDGVLINGKRYCNECAEEIMEEEYVRG